MRAMRYLTALAFVAAIGAAGPASAVTTVKIIAANGTWLNYAGYSTRSLAATVWGAGWQCAGAAISAGQFLGGATGANCASTGGGTVVYLSGGEWWVDYP